MIVVPQIAFRGQQVAVGDELPPVRATRELVRLGAVEVALHDLDGVLAGDMLPQWAQAIVAVAGVPLRFDGLLHDGARIERLAKAGFRSIVVDQAAVFDAMLLRWALDLYGRALIVEIQADGPYVFDPPAGAFGNELVDVLGELHFRGARRLLFRDVTGTSVPLEQLLELGDRLPGMRITYQGTAASTLQAISALAQVGPALEAVLVPADGVLDGSLDISAANAIAAGA